ncbi:LysR family transcriptional regulator [Glaciecola sp. 1036]|uniref:LysR family transcriptional regulator n=1 Tax=Alteromonadaceae TaxID=72275 RepID=UPI003D02E126
MIRADDILLFVQVVETGSFSKVADMLQLTNSVVSKRIGRLEDTLNVQLLYRTTRKLSLTDAGKALYSKALIAKTAMQDATDVVCAYSNEVKGTIKITMPVITAQLVLGQSIAEFCNEYPDIKIDLQVTNRVVDLVDEGFDIAIRTAHLEDSSLIARKLVESKWIVCASPKYLKKHGTPLHPNELHEHECLQYKYDSSGVDHWQFNINGVEQQLMIKGRFISNNLIAVKEAALADLGICFLPQALAHDDVERRRLIPILNRYTNKSMGIYAVYPRTRQPDHKIKLLIDHFKASFGKKQQYFI